MSLKNAPAWYVISLRPQGEHAALRRAAARSGAGLVALSPWKLVARDDDLTRDQLRQALLAQVVLFTSPAAVRFAHALQPLQALSNQTWIGTGSGTRNALLRAGISGAIAPNRMDSDGVLALPALANLDQRSVGLITAPDGRGVLAPALQTRGALVQQAEIYERQTLVIPASAWRRLHTLTEPTCVALTSAAALNQLIQQLPAESAQLLVTWPAIVASARLSETAAAAGFTQLVKADGPRPAQLIRAANAFFSRRFR